MAKYKKRAIPNAIRREVCINAGASIGASVEVPCKLCGALGLIEWSPQYAYWPVIHRLHLDHIIPERWGGEMTASNFQMLCPSCNKRKKDTIPKEVTQDAYPFD